MCILIVILLVVIIPKIQVSDTNTNTIDTMDYWLEEEIALLYLYYIK